MLALDPGTERQLRQSRIEVQIPDDDTLVLRNVPADRRFFNKSCTNLLFTRPQPGMPFIIGVDEDLKYTGKDRSLARAFSGGCCKQGWCLLNLSYSAQENLERLVNYTLHALGFESTLPAPGAAAPDSGSKPNDQGVLATFGRDLTQCVRDGIDEPTAGRSEQIGRITASLLEWRPRLPLVVGESGVGKTNLLYAVARSLIDRRPALRVVSVHLGVLMAGTLLDSERENLLGELIEEAEEGCETVLGLEHLELGILSNPRGSFLLCQALDQGVKVIGTTLPPFVSVVCTDPLFRRIDLVNLDEMSRAESLKVLECLQERIARHHGVGIGNAVLEAAVDRSISLAGRLPAKAVKLLDAATARARLAGASEVDLCHVYIAATEFPGE